MNKLSLGQQVLLVGFCTLIFGYLVGSFINVTFNITKWNETLRGIIAIFSIIASAISMAAYTDFNK